MLWLSFTNVRLSAGRGFGDDVHRAFGVGRFVVERRRDDAVGERHEAHRQLDRAAAVAEVAEEALRRGDRHVAERRANRLRFGPVVFERAVAVGVDVADVERFELRGRQRRLDRPANRVARRLAAIRPSVRSGEAAPAIRASGRTPRRSAWSRLSSTNSAAPSP